jgi:hypothetical protein
MLICKAHRATCLTARDVHERSRQFGALATVWSARNLLRNLLALAWMTPKVAAAAATATNWSARNLLRNVLALE